MGLRFEDVDARVRGLLAEQGITSLYPPQEQALDAALSGRNLVLSIPTASGKSLVAYLALLHRFLLGRPPGKGLYIVPLRALASEKYDELRTFQKALGLRVGLATGDLDDEDTRLGRYDVVIATSEKADSLLRHRAAWMHDVRTIVADEVHLLHDAGRGPTLEVLLARFRALNPKAQILALSATIRNARELAHWLQADLVTSDWRPTRLKRGVLFERDIDFLADGHRTLGPDTGDPVADLVLDILAEGGQALVFLSTRRSAEATAKALARAIEPRLSPAERERLQALARALADDEDAVEQAETASAPSTPPREAPPPLEVAPTTLGGKLARAVRGGAAFHNAGLTARQRRLVEGAFREGLLKALAATPTLAAGVNTPARRVIIRDVYRYDANLGNQPLPVLEVQQMMGRAGRPRYDPYGEAVLVAKTEEDRDALTESYLKSEPEAITSKLGTEPALRVHILASVAAGFAHDRAALERFLDSTFYAHQGEAWLIKEQLTQVLRFLEENDFVHRSGDRLEPTPFGRRTSELYIDPLSALILRRTVERAKERGDVDLFAFLHAVASTPDLDPLYLRAKDHEWIFEKLAAVEERLVFEPHEAHSREDFLSQIKTATLLEDWIEERPMRDLEQRYGVGPGDVRNKIDRAEWLVHALRELARLFHFETATALHHLPLRLRHGARAELLPLIELEGIGRVRARALWRAGYPTLGTLRKAREQELARLPTIGPALARSLKKQVGSEPAAEAQLQDFGG